MTEELKVIISAEMEKFASAVSEVVKALKSIEKAVEGTGDNVDKEMSESEKSVKSFKDRVKEASADVDSNISKMGEGIKNGLKVVGTSIAAAGTALIALGASTQEYRNEQAKLVTAFQDAGGSAETAKQTYNDLYRVLGEDDTAVEAANHLAKMTTNQKELNQWTTICQGVYATFGASLPIEGLTEAANETAKVGQVTGSLADALNWAGVSEDAFNEKLAACNTEAEREKLIRETLNGIYDDAAASYEKNNAEVLKQNEAQAKLQETTAKLGEAIAPVVTAFTSFASDALAVVVPYIQELAQEYMPELQEALKNVSEGLESAFTWASQHQTLLAVIGGIIATVTAAIVAYNAVAAVKTAMAAAEVTSVWALVSAYAAQAVAVMAALAPYVAITAAIAAVIAIIVLCVKHWDEIKAKVVEVAKAVWNKVKEMVDKVVGFFQKLLSWVGDNWQGLLLLIVNPFAGAFKLAYDNCTEFREKVNEVFNKIKTTISEKVQAAKETVVTKFEEIKSGIKNKIQSAKENVTSTFNSIKSAIMNPINEAKQRVSDAVETIKSKFKFKWSLPKPSLPKFSVSGGKAPWGFMGKGSLPKVSITWNKLGGVFDKPTLFNYAGSLQGIGEDGAEAVVPLEKNTQWLDRIADKLAAKQNGIPIVLQVDGKTFAQVSIDSINALTKQRGKLGLNVV